MKLTAHGKTDKELVRESNEDEFCVEKNLGFLAVADGMGGHASGEVASKMAIDIVRDYLRNERELLSDKMLLGIALANKAIYNASQSQSHLKGMGTTIAAVLFNGDRFSVAHVGDSRVYLIRGGQIDAAIHALQHGNGGWMLGKIALACQPCVRAAKCRTVAVGEIE